MSEWQAIVRAHVQRGGLDARQFEEVVDEIAAHLDRAYTAARAQGLDDGAARAAALHELDGLEAAALRRPAPKRFRWRGVWQAIAQDVGYSWRALRARPGFTMAALLTLALGIGANTAIFTVVHAVLIRDLPYPEPSRLVHVYETFQSDRFSSDHGVVNPANLDRWQRETTAFTHLAPIRMTAATLTGAGDATRVSAPLVAPEFFDVMGVPPLEGRVFSVDEAAGGARVVVLSHNIWLTRFGGDRTIVGRPITLNDDAWTVIGIMPAGFAFPTGAEAWRPLHLSAATRAARTSWFLGVVARLRPGASLAQAQAELDAVSAALAAEFPRQKGRGAKAFELHGDLTARVTDGLTLLQSVVVVVLLIACANLANLQIAQASGRARELAVRAAMGAVRARLAGQLLTESLLLAVIGGALGTVVAVVGVPLLVSLAPTRLLPSFVEIEVSLVTLLFTIGLSAVCGVLFGVAPAWLFSRPNLVDTLRLDGPSATGAGRGGQRWLRPGLIAAEVALAFVLVFGSVLLVRSFGALMSQETGFRPERLMTASITLPGRYATPESQLQFWSDLFGRLRSTPGVEGVAASTALPFSNWEWQTNFEIEGRRDLKHDGAGIRSITAGYFGQLGIPLQEGRDIHDTDRAGAEAVAVVNAAFARAFSEGRSMVGVRIRTDLRANDWITIVGVAGDTRHVTLAEDPDPEIYRPLAQVPQAMLTVAMRTTGDAETAVPTLREAVRLLDRSVPLEGVRSMDTLVGQTVAERRFHMALLAAFALVAAVLALVGIYGVTAYIVGLRTREAGIRLALGATSRAVTAVLASHGLRPVVVGLVAGVGLSLFAVRLIESQLFGVDAHDPLLLMASCAVFLIAGAAACLLPAYRTSRVSPLETLRR